MNNTKVEKKTSKSPLFFLVLSLLTIGFIFISISSLSEASTTVGDKFYFLKKQSIWMMVSLVAFFVASKINIEYLKKYSFILYGITMFFLVIVLIPGVGNEALGARRWIDLGFASLQPTDLLKLTSIIYFSHLFSNQSKRNIKNLVIYLGIAFALIIAEPNLSTAILISAIVVTIYYVSGGEIKSLFGLCLSIVLLSSILIIVSPYRAARLKSLIDPQTNQSSSSYHTNQIILTLSSGGFFGKGFANSDQKYRFLPKISTDSILAVIGEETGFVGITVVLFFYISLISYLMKLSKLINDQFQSLIVAGVASWIAFQTLVNMAAIAAVIPLTGVPLPFISYGGSALVTLMTGIGLIYNIEKNNSLLIYSNSEQDSASVKNHSHRHHPPYSGHRARKTT